MSQRSFLPGRLGLVWREDPLWIWETVEEWFIRESGASVVMV